MKNNSKAQSFFTDEEQKQIRNAVHQAELKTSGELVPMLVCESNSYPLAGIRGATLAALLTALLASPFVADMFWLESSNVWAFLGVFIPVFLGVHLLIEHSPMVKRLLLSEHEMNAEVHHAAFVSFFTEQLHRTKDSNGILIFISLLERRAWIIADSGINDRIPQEHWEDAVSIITNGIRSQEQCRALCEAILLIGTTLEREFPVQDDDVNELHDLIIR